MDPISYGVAAKQKQRIEKVIAEPDSTSGVITVPKVIAAGETITVPAGRTAVLPNVQVDGVLDVQGDVFIPSGAGLSTVIQKSGDTMTGNLNFASGTKITGDFSNGTIGNRVVFQTSTSNSNTIVSAIPNGTATESYISVRNNSNAANASSTSLGVTAGLSVIDATKTGSGSYLPLTFNTGGAERMRIDTSGNVGIGATASSGTKLRIEQPSGVNGNTSPHIRNSYAGYGAFDFGMESDTSMIENIDPESHWISSSTALIKSTRYRGVPKINYYADGGIQVVGGGAIGYGTGSGGTVTQLTSKSTAVTLNKPCGYIIMNNAALNAGAIVTFIFNNSIISYTDQVLITRATTGTTAGYNIWIDSVGNGACTVVVKNISASSLSEAIVLSFEIIKGTSV